MSETLLYWLPCASVLLHIGEEFVWPGGFAAWFKVYRPETGASFTPAFAVVMNGLLIAVAASLGAIGPHWSRGVSLWLTLMALLAYNGIFHLIGALRTRRYSPGMVTGLLVYLPLCLAGALYFMATGQADFMLVVTAIAVSALYPLWSYHTHRSRAARYA